MNINASIIDQRVGKIAQDYQDGLEAQIGRKLDEERLRSAAFTLLCVQAVLDIEFDEALELMTEGGGDGGIDALHVGDIQDGEFTVSLFQSKYRRKLDGESNFEENAIVKMINSVGSIFDPGKNIALHPQLLARVEDIRSLVRDGNIPTVRVFLCNNGKTWTDDAGKRIEAAGFGKQVTWTHVNHDTLIDLFQSLKPVNATMHLTGKAVVEDFNFRRVLIGRVPVQTIHALFEAHGERLLERNIRRYLGLHKNRVNEGIRDTLLDPEQRPNFYFYNNGITLICTKFRHSALQQENYAVQIEDLQVINGGQTCMTIRETLKDHPDGYEGACVLLRLYELSDEDENLVHEITYATNSQNPVDLRDLRSNDPAQRKLEQAVQGLGYEYRRKRDASSASPGSIPVSVAAEAILAIWRRKPHVAKFRGRELFGKHYEEIFTSRLNAAQLILAVLIFRYVDGERRKRSADKDAPRYLPYATHFLAMIFGELLLEANGLKDIHALDHRNFAQVKQYFEGKRDELYANSMNDLETALKELGLMAKAVTLQRLAASFRRGDLLGTVELNHLLS